MNSTELREKFLQFFEGTGHKVVPSSSLVPSETDPTVLFTTAGMQQFKRYYLEPNEAPAARITTVQKCVRTGDIDEVGDNTHLTFFEMLGNFTFGYPEKEGSYFKKEATLWAWKFLTEILKIKKSRIYATYFNGEHSVPADQESFEILESIDGLSKVVPQGFDDNFWSLGTENSPGGPTVEFYIDGVEVWNLVFNEYVFKNGIYEPSNLKGIDTGMGLERLAVMMQDVKSVYETDLFLDLISIIEEISSKKYEDNNKEFRIIADHIKAAVFIIGDGVLPSNKGAGYIVRRLIRRAVVKAQQVGIADSFTTKLAEKIFLMYKGIYFDAQNAVILSELEKEEIKFRRTLKEGLKLLGSHKEITGKILFDLYQSYGLPMEISVEEATARNIEINNSTIEQFNNLLREHQALSRTASAGMFKGGLAEAGEMTTKYHTATHLLLAALRQVLGDQIFQKGSNITAERMRFDFSYPEKLTADQIKQVEDIVNQKIAEDLPVLMKEMSLEDAKKCGAMGVFESKYGDNVKTYKIGDPSTDSTNSPQAGSGQVFSNEICGGPHVGHTGELGHFKILKEESSSSGVRRIKAVLE